MRLLVFLHGIFGSRLGVPGEAEVIWPPTPSEMIRNYYPDAKAQKLLRDDLQVRGVIDRVSCCDIYGSLLQDLNTIGYGEGNPERRLIVHAYDWRIDLRTLSSQLADRLDAEAEGADRILLLAHSMGGLVARHLLESAHYRDRGWFDRVTDLITMGTPHLGAPLALRRAAGLEGSMALSPAQTAALSADPRYPSAYQLLPPPGALYVRDIARGEDDADHPDVHDPAFASAFNLSTANLTANADFYGELEEQPDAVRYFQFASAAKETVVRYTRLGPTLTAETERGGDETVPVSSAAGILAPTAYVNGAHGKIFKVKALREQLYLMLGAPPGVRPVSAQGVTVGAALVEDIVPPDDPVAAGAEFEVLVNFAAPVERFDDQLRLTVNDAVTLPDGAPPEGRVYNVFYEGPPLKSLALRLTAPQAPGFYAFDFAEARTDDPTPPVLMVGKT